MISLHMSTILPMIDFLQKMKTQEAKSNLLRELFAHPDYDFEFRRYEIESKDKELLIDYFMHLNSVTEDTIPVLNSERNERKNMLKNKHKRWLYAYENLEYYMELYEKINSAITNEMLKKIYARVQKGLPDNTEIDDVRIISTMSIGMSFGYVFEGAIHFDMMGFGNDCIDTLPSLIAHETHHLEMWKYVSSFINSLTLEERFIFNFSGEGLAIKFCNNAEGTISKAIDNTYPKNEGLDDFSIRYLNNHFEETFRVFENTLSDIRSNKMSKDEVFKHIEEYWWNPYTEEQNRDEEPLLKQTRMYSFGNDLFGSIYDVYGKETLFDCVRHPLKAVEYFKCIMGN